MTEPETEKDDFEKADEDGGETEAEVVEEAIESSMPVVMSLGSLATPRDMMEFRQQLIEMYHRGSRSLVERLNKEDRNNPRSLVMALVGELVTETDNLLGNQMIATQHGSLRDASVMSSKRAEVLEKAIKAVQNKQQFEKDHGFNVDHPAMQCVWRYFMEKAHAVLRAMRVDAEANDTFFRMLVEQMKEWKKELQQKIEEEDSLKE